jgi:hypothetical protein
MWLHCRCCRYSAAEGHVHMCVAAPLVLLLLPVPQSTCMPFFFFMYSTNSSSR